VIANPPRPTNPPPRQESAWTVFKDKDGCMAAVKVDCPQGATCNPPPPTKYACPEGVTLDQPITVVTFGDTCAIERRPVQCPPHAVCNPPPPRRVPCPQ
jgi:hypothetical protein